jgi:hypothetical protein
MQEEKRFMRISDSGTAQSELERPKKHLAAMLDWFKRALEYETFLLTNSLRYKIRQGEVYEIDFGRNVGSELNERHYAVVLHHSDEDAQNIVVVPLTTKIHYSYGEAIELGYLEGIRTNEKSMPKLVKFARSIKPVFIYDQLLVNGLRQRIAANLVRSQN